MGLIGQKNPWVAFLHCCLMLPHVIDHSQNLRFQVCCIFGCSLFLKRGTKHTRKHNTLKMVDSEKGQLPVFSGVCLAPSYTPPRLKSVYMS